jgi:hypothetical protein
MLASTHITSAAVPEIGIAISEQKFFIASQWASEEKNCVIRYRCS